MEPESGYIKKKAVIKEFAETILSALGNDRDEWFKENGLTGDDTDVAFSYDFPRWQLCSLAYFIHNLSDGILNIVNFAEDEFSSPQFDTIEYKRGEILTFLANGFMAITIDNKPMVISINDYGRIIKFILWCKKEDKNIGEKFFKQFKNDVSLLQFLKNEKFLITEQNKIQFLKYPDITRKDLILDSKIWNTFDRDLFFIIKNKENVLAHNLEWRRGILIWGLPGTGKTLFGKVLCNEIDNTTIIWITPRCIDDESDVSKIFKLARMLSPTILFFEDIDFFAGSRDEGNYDYVLGELLAQLDGLSPNDGVFIVATTNKPGILDHAITSRPARFDIKIKFELPTYEERIEMYKLFLKNRDDVDYKILARRSDGMTGAYIKETCVRGTLSILQNKEVALEAAIIDGIKSIKKEEMKPTSSSVHIS